MNTNTKTTILIKTDKKVKAAAQRNLKRAGIPLSTFLNMHLREAARDDMRIEVGLVPNARTMRSIKAGIREYREGKTPGPFATVEELFKELKS